MLTCPWCGYPHGSTDERGPPVGGVDGASDRAPAQNEDGSFYCPRCEESVRPEGV